MRESGPTAVMRQEHKQTKQHLEAIHERPKRQDPQSDDEERMLLHILSLHNQKEERILYPMLDRLISANEMDSVFKKMESILEERCGHCSAIIVSHVVILTDRRPSRYSFTAIILAATLKIDYYELFLISVGQSFRTR